MGLTLDTFWPSQGARTLDLCGIPTFLYALGWSGSKTKGANVESPPFGGGTLLPAACRWKIQGLCRAGRCRLSLLRPLADHLREGPFWIRASKNHNHDDTCYWGVDLGPSLRVTWATSTGQGPEENRPKTSAWSCNQAFRSALCKILLASEWCGPQAPEIPMRQSLRQRPTFSSCHVE